MAEITTNFRDSNQGDLGKNLVSKEYLLNVYPKIASQIVPSGTLFAGGGGASGLDLSKFITKNALGSPYTPVNFLSGYNNWKYLDSFPAAPQIFDKEKLSIIKNDGTLWNYGVHDGRLGNSVLGSTPVQEFTSSTNWKIVSIGYKHRAAIKTDGTLWSWGSNYAGQLGNLSTFSSGQITTPVQESTSSTNWKSVKCGNEITIATKTDGTLWSWGNNYNGNLGINQVGLVRNYLTNVLINPPYRSSPCQVGTSNNWDRVICASQQGNSVSNFYNYNIGTTVVSKTDGTLWGWGSQGASNEPGRLGTGFFDWNIDARYTLTPSPFNISAGYTWKTVPTTITSEDRPISLLSGTSFGIRNDNTFWWWGQADAGFNGIIYAPILNPWCSFTFGQEWTSSTNWKQISSSVGMSNVAVKTDGTLWGWANMNYNVSSKVAGVYAASAVQWKTPYQINASTTWRQASSGQQVCAATKTDNTLWIWGYDGAYTGILSLNNGQSNTTPIQESTLATNWKQVVVGDVHAAAIKTDGTLWLWGLNTYGQLGTNDKVPRSTPVREFTSSTNWTQVSLTKGDSQYSSTLAIKSDGTLWGWGANNYNQLGRSDISLEVITPVREWSSSTNWRYVEAARQFTAALKTDGTLWSWGFNYYGQLGKNDLVSRPTPVQEYTSSTNWNFVCCSSSHTLALKNDGTLWGWGFNTLGSTGKEEWRLNQKLTPVQEYSLSNQWGYVDGLSSSSQGGNSSQNIIYGIKTDGSLWNLSTGSYNTGNSIGLVSSNWNKVFCGYGHVYGIKTDGTLWQWSTVNNFPVQFQPWTGADVPATSPAQVVLNGYKQSNWKKVYMGKHFVIGEVFNT